MRAASFMAGLGLLLTAPTAVSPTSNALALSATEATKQEPAKVPRTAQQRAYTLSLMCAVVASHYNNDADKLKTIDALRKMAAVMGYDNARMAKDLSTMASVLGDELRSDPNAMEGHRASCRKIGLIS